MAGRQGLRIYGKKTSIITFCIALVALFAGAAFAVEFQTVPIMQQYQPPSDTNPATQPSGPELPGPSPEALEPAPQTTPGQPPGEAPSEFERFISGEVSLGVSTKISQFGYELFRNPPSTFAPVEKVPVSLDYVIGPGDEIRITVWGNVEGHWNVLVDRDGSISLPKVGVVGVTGLTFGELKELLHREFSGYYTGFQMNVSMGALRTIRVYVVGNARRPGAYTVSSLSTLVNALFEAGGPGKTGTMRDIRIKRGGKTVADFDMYDFLLKGDKSGDARLMPEDVIFIPPVGNLVGIAGNVKKPAIYEIKGEARLLDLIEMAGGLTSNAFKGRVQVQRIEDHRFRTIFEGDLIDMKETPEKNFALNDGDLIKVFSVFETKNTVLISGAVASPGEYGVVQGETKVSEVVSLAGGLLYYASDTAEITRVTATQDGPMTERLIVDLSKAVRGDPGHDITLEVNDYISVRPVPEWQLYQTVTIGGEVRYPGRYTIKKGERLSSLIERAGGFTSKAYLKGAVFTRQKVKEIQQERIREMAERLEMELFGMSAAEVAASLSPEEARIEEAEIQQKRDFVAKLKTIKAKGRMTIALKQLELLKDTLYDIELQEGDELFVPVNPRSIQVLGSVYNQTAFVYDRDKSYLQYIDIAGGYTRNADKKRVYIFKADGTAVRPGSGISWNRWANRWDVGGRDMDPGDTIVVPEKLERISWMREIKDITQILYQIAVTAGVLIVAF
jgi:protein involved in polysaccharide export with SLBB domain